MRTASISYRSPFDLATLGTVRREIAGRLPGTGLGPDQAGDALLAVAEILGNAIRHGGGSGIVAMVRWDRQVRLVVRDRGPGITPGPAPRITASPPVTALHGRGLWLTLALRSDVRLTSSPRGTRVTLVIVLPPATGLTSVNT